MRPAGARTGAGLDDPNERVNVSLQVVPDPTPGKNELHLDLYNRDRGDCPGNEVKAEG